MTPNRSPAGLVKMGEGFLAAIELLVRALGEVLARPDVQARIEATVCTLQAVHERIEAFESPGYAPYFERLGHSGFSARMQAATVRSLAERHCRQSRDKRIALSALHDLTRRPRWHLALARQVDRLRDTCWDADFVGRAWLVATPAVPSSRAS